MAGGAEPEADAQHGGAVFSATLGRIPSPAVLPPTTAARRRTSGRWPPSRGLAVACRVKTQSPGRVLGRVGWARDRFKAPRRFAQDGHPPALRERRRCGPAIPARSSGTATTPSDWRPRRAHTCRGRCCGSGGARPDRGAGQRATARGGQAAARCIGGSRHGSAGSPAIRACSSRTATTEAAPTTAQPCRRPSRRCGSGAARRPGRGVGPRATARVGRVVGVPSTRACGTPVSHAHALVCSGG
jgi:hypothetical protein